jgi:hypothetical protein
MQFGDTAWLKTSREPLMQFLVDFSLEHHRKNS